MFTAPIGYNTYLDKLLIDQAARFSQLRAMRRISWKNEWVEDDLKNARGVKRPEPPYRTSYGVVIATIERNLE